MSACTVESTTGSSPLARGTRLGLVGCDCARRLIPARAGNTAFVSMSRMMVSAHPRSRGEHSSPHSEATRAVGSSPLARGTPGERLRQDTASRLIPARAGNTQRQQPNRRRRPAHPRSRGEHFTLEVIARLKDGSSPLARGTLQLFGLTRYGLRLIPARAGNTLLAGHADYAVSAHPRSRGEHGLCSFG